MPSKNLLKVVLPALRVETRTALFRASQSSENVTISNVSVEVEGESRMIDLHVRPAHDSGSGNDYFLVVFEEKTSSDAAIEARCITKSVRHLEQELEATRTQLSAMVNSTKPPPRS